MDKKRVTIYDIAKALNVNASSVTRALNGRKGVSDKLRDAIIFKANEMGYRTNLIAKSLVREKLRIGFIVNERVHGFNDRVIDGARFAAKELVDFNVEGQFKLLPCIDLRKSIETEIGRMVDEGIDGVVFVPSSGGEYDSFISRLAQSGIAVGTVILHYSHPEVAFSVYPDGKRAGHIASDLLNIAGVDSGAEVLITLGSSTFVSHNECVMGFNEAGARFGYRAKVIQHYDDAETAYRLVYKYLEESPSIKGIYCSTGTTAPICHAVRDLGRNDIKVIGTEITSETRSCFEDGNLIASLFQDPFQQGRKAFKAMYEYLESMKSKHISDIQINPEIVVPGNLSYYEQFLIDQQSGLTTEE